VKFGRLCLLAAGVLAASVSLRVEAQQQRTGKDGVYTAAQAARGEAVYRDKCVACHGAMLEGVVGPPLAGDDFLGLWAAPPLSDLYDKIHNTMPADAPGSLTPAQAVDVVAYIVQVNKFPAGRAALGPDPAALKLVALEPMRRQASPAATAAAGVATGAADFPAVGTLNQIMRGILFPSSNVLFDVQTQDPGGAGQGGTAQAGASATTIRYGNVYSPWQVVDAAAISIAEAAPLLLSPGRRCENGKPAPVDRADWQAAVRGLVDAGKVAYKASQTRSQEAVSEATNVISDACAACHKVYRDRPTAAERCTPLP
jgi:cytochrome c